MKVIIYCKHYKALIMSTVVVRQRPDNKVNRNYTGKSEINSHSKMA